MESDISKEAILILTELIRDSLNLLHSMESYSIILGGNYNGKNNLQ